jgi:hypothetical protein
MRIYAQMLAETTRCIKHLPAGPFFRERSARKEGVRSRVFIRVHGRLFAVEAFYPSIRSDGKIMMTFEIVSRKKGLPQKTQENAKTVLFALLAFFAAIHFPLRIPDFGIRSSPGGSGSS